MSRRSEDEDEEETTAPFATGSIAPSSWHEEDRPIGRIYVPDLEARRGWREFYIHRPAEKPNARPAGFSKP